MQKKLGDNSKLDSWLLFTGYPDPPILAFFDFLAFFVFRIPLLFCAFFLPFPRLLGVPRREKPLLFFFFRIFPCFFQKSKGWRVRVINGENQARKRHININVLVRLHLGRPPVCPWDKPGLSQGQTQVVPGTNRAFLFILHSGSPVCPWDKPGLSLEQTGGEWRQQKFMCQMFMCPLTLQPLLFWKKQGKIRKKARVFLFAEPLKSLEKEGKTHKKAREVGKRKKQGNRKKQGLEGQGKGSGP